jgi:hypothetical protein
MNNKLSIYKRKSIAAIKAEAEKTHGATSVSHIFPRAYCVAKPEHFKCAVFAIPPCDAEPQAYHRSNIIIENETAIKAEVGKWYSIAYCVQPSGDQTFCVIFSL